MNDRELLELAAKAAGMTGCGLFWDEKSHALWDGEGLWFDPLTDDGDALRLAVKLEMDILHRVVGGKRIETVLPGVPTIREPYDDEQRAVSTRRAITRAAAEMGRRMK